MHIQALQLKHTLHFSDIQLQFNYPQCPVTLILGNQGTGKTTLLRFSYQALTFCSALSRQPCRGSGDARSGHHAKPAAIQN